MSYTTEHIARTLKAARESKGLSQRALSKKAGVPQGHISKIENGAVDLRLSSLIALARALDLETTLVPRKTVPAVQSIVRNVEQFPGRSGEAGRSALKELKRLHDTIANVTKMHPALKELAQLQRQVRELQHFQFAIPEIKTLEEANKAVQAFKEQTQGLEALRQSVSQLQKLRNALVHAHSLPEPESVRPAYGLDGDDDA